MAASKANVLKSVEMADVAEAQVRRISVVGTPISLISLSRLLHVFEQWIASPRDRYVVFRDVHGVVAARNDVDLDLAHKGADIVAPDGMPLVWALRATGASASRVCGPDTLLATCEYGLSRGWKHYFYGGATGVAERLVEELSRKFPGLNVVGTQSPPFRQLAPDEDEQACAKIRAAQPDLVWVCLGTPKQEIWMSEHQGKCGGAIMLGVGAAFDFHALLIRRAPRWMQKTGLEWVFRLFTDPKRLWKRYLMMGPVFVALATWEVLLTPLATMSKLEAPD
jgi:N-acetylglucosaminyldiphosphoundecaprenol N-acetyl-beta-D-mannosaminyltransferase